MRMHTHYQLFCFVFLKCVKVFIRVHFGSVVSGKIILSIKVKNKYV